MPFFEDTAAEYQAEFDRQVAHGGGFQARTITSYLANGRRWYAGIWSFNP